MTTLVQGTSESNQSTIRRALYHGGEKNET